MIQKTCFDYVIGSLSPEFATEVRDLLFNPPEDRPYDTLKTQLIKRTAASAQHKLQQLISGEELGDRKLSQLLRHMQQLYNCHRSRTSVRVQSLERTQKAPGIETRHNNRLPPPVERHGQFSPTAQSSAESSTQSIRMDGFSATSTPWNPNGAEGRYPINSS